MANVVEICNKALSHNGIGTVIQSIDEQSEEARQCKIHFDSIVREVLSDHSWNFALVIEPLTLSTFPAPKGWAYKYVYPSDALTITNIPQDDRTLDKIKHRVMLDNDRKTKCIVTDEEFAEIEYVADVSQFPSLFSPQFVTALSWRLAAEIAVPLTQDEGKLETALNFYVNLLDKAKTTDSSEGEPDDVRNTDWDNERLA